MIHRVTATAAAAALIAPFAAWPPEAHADPPPVQADPSEPEPAEAAPDGRAAEPPPADPPAAPDAGTPDGVATPLPSPLPPGDAPRVKANPAPRFPQHYLFGNGLSLILTRLSVGYEYLPIAHHAIGLSIYGQYGGGIASELVGMKGAFVGVGSEVAYRFYAWRDGPFGPFLGMSFLSGYYHTQSSIFALDPHAFRYAQYGPAVDFGWSVHLDRTAVLALSLGAQYTFVDANPRELPELTRLLVGDGPRPRGGVQVGKIFW
jgi:hypothetical protein